MIVGYQCIYVLCVKCPSIVERYNCVDNVDHGVFVNT